MNNQEQVIDLKKYIKTISNKIFNLKTLLKLCPQGKKKKTLNWSCNCNKLITALQKRERFPHTKEKNCNSWFLSGISIFHETTSKWGNRYSKKNKVNMLVHHNTIQHSQIPGFLRISKKKIEHLFVVVFAGLGDSDGLQQWGRARIVSLSFTYCSCRHCGPKHKTNLVLLKKKSQIRFQNRAPEEWRRVRVLAFSLLPVLLAGF